MSALPDNEFDLEKLFLPAWATEPSKSSEATRSRETAEEAEGRPARRRKDRSRGGRRPEMRRGPAPSPASAPAGAKAPAPGPARGAKPTRAPLPDLQVRLIPDPKGVELVARRIRSTGRAFPLFEIAKLFLDRPERYSVEIGVKKKADGTVLQPLFVCALDETPWLSADEVVAHVLEKHFDTFYQVERTPTEPPKGKYTFVAQCGLSGVILGPPNHHDYPNRVRQLHAERFSHMPFEAYKARIKIVRDEAVVKQWLEEQSWKTEYITLNVPEPMRLGSREAVARHFREVHAPNIVRQVDLITLPGQTARDIPCRELARLVRHTIEEQRHFPLQLATALSQQFAAHGLQFFKVNRTITHVAVARPHYLDIENTPVSLNVKRIVQYILDHPHCTRRDLLEALAPSPQPSPQPPEAPAAAQGETTAPSQPPPPRTPTPEQTQIIADLHWLIHQGHVIEFSTGALEVAKKPAPKPAKAAATAQTSPKVSAPAEPATAEAAVQGEQPPEQPAQSEAGEVTGPSPAPGGESTVSESEATEHAAVATTSTAAPGVQEPTSDSAAPTTTAPVSPPSGPTLEGTESTAAAAPPADREMPTDSAQTASHAPPLPPSAEEPVPGCSRPAPPSAS